MKVWVNTIVYNEEIFLWFAIKSIIDFVDKIIIFDTGSTDKTVKIIKELQSQYPRKIIFQEFGPVDKYQYTKARQEMLDNSNCDWILVLDGDEIWWKVSIKKVIEEIKKNGEKIEGIVVPFYNAVGDLFHYQSESAGEYQILGRKGHLTLRAFKKNIPGLHVDNPYGSEGYFDHDQTPIQHRKKIIFLQAPFLHLTHLKRSSKKQKQEKHKYELGQGFSKNFKLPEVFNLDFPSYINNPLEKRSFWYMIKSTVRFPGTFLWRNLRKIKK